MPDLTKRLRITFKCGGSELLVAEREIEGNGLHELDLAARDAVADALLEWAGRWAISEGFTLSVECIEETTILN